MNLGIIGCGNMATAILQGLLKENPSLFKIIYCQDISVEKTNLFHRKFNCISINNIPELIKLSDYILIAVKPQNLKDIITFFSKSYNNNKLIISILAGIKINYYKEHLDENSKIVRVMPNTPALVNSGISGLAFSSSITDNDKKNIHKIFSSIGNFIDVDESMIDAITAISGSGPAYIFYIIESMLAAAKRFNFDDENAYKLIIETIIGSIKLLQNKKCSPNQLRKQVTSPGGTTEAAIKYFEEHKLQEILINGISAAKNRSIELSNLY